jgi:HPt (histidine-containing phosphotransfer) domain-containing protein
MEVFWFQEARRNKNYFTASVVSTFRQVSEEGFVSGHPPINHDTLSALRMELGTHFARILSYFAEDGVQSVQAIEDAVGKRDAVALVRPAHTLKGESLQFGCEALGYAAEHIEKSARAAVEAHAFPLEIVDFSPKLRPLFEEALAALQHAAAPKPVAAAPLRRPAAFGRKVG